MRLVFAGASDVGLARAENQDSIFVPDPGETLSGKGPALFFLADGMGGSQGGSLASQTAVAELRAYFANQPARDLSKALNGAVRRASEAIQQKAVQDPLLRGMGTTIVALALQDGRALVANLGDSRCYLFHSGRLEQITEDHSVVAQQVREGKITAEEARTSSMRNLITKAAGAVADARPDLFSIKLDNGDVLLLCSDGLHGPVEDPQIARVLGSGLPLADQARALIGLANQAGGPDNISVILVRVEEVEAGEASAKGGGTEKVSQVDKDFQAREARGPRLAMTLKYLAIMAGFAAACWWFFNR